MSFLLAATEQYSFMEVHFNRKKRDISLPVVGKSKGSFHAILPPTLPILKFLAGIGADAPCPCVQSIWNLS